jgi:hypothetical protein
MKSFNEWLKEKRLEEGIADYTPGFIREPLQRMGVMGQTSYEKEQERLRDKRAANDAEDEAKERKLRSEIERNKEKRRQEEENARKARARPNATNEPTGGYNTYGEPISADAQRAYRGY